jgi:hypothetical protein
MRSLVFRFPARARAANGKCALTILQRSSPFIEVALRSIFHFPHPAIMGGNQEPACSPRHAVLADYIGSGGQCERISEDRTPEDGEVLTLFIRQQSLIRLLYHNTI